MKLTPSQLKAIQIKTKQLTYHDFVPVLFSVSIMCDGSALLSVLEERLFSTEYAGFSVGKRGAVKLEYKSEHFIA